MKSLNECLKPHPLVHTVTGVGVGLLLAGLFSGLAAQGVLLGIIVVAAGTAYDYFMVK